MSVLAPAAVGLVMPLNVMRTLSPAAVASPPNSEHLITVPLGLPQAPTEVALVTSKTAPPV